MKIEALPQFRARRRRRQLVAVAVCLVLLLAAGTAFYFQRSTHRQPAGTSRSSTATISISKGTPLNLPPPDLLKPVTPEEALKENAERAFSGRPDTPAAAFKLTGDVDSRERALECLTQAVYYEAGTEGSDGQRAVAQVILNRMRHGAYPHSVCGVIYQGSDRPTGCQFTFTCDGSLARVPLQSLWKQSETVAREALSGKVYAPVGHATHYHADYVLPYWADSLDKSVQVGRHIFYRLKNGLGAPGAFRSTYAGVEPLPPPPSAGDIPLEAVDDAEKALAAPVEEDPLKVSAGELITKGQPEPNLTADSDRGTLVIDSGTPIIKSTRREETAACSSAGGGKPLRPIVANDVRVQNSASACP